MYYSTDRFATSSRLGKVGGGDGPHQVFNFALEEKWRRSLISSSFVVVVEVTKVTRAENGPPLLPLVHASSSSSSSSSTEALESR